MRSFCKEQYVVLMPIRICNERSESVKPAKPLGIIHQSNVVHLSVTWAARAHESARSSCTAARLKTAILPRNPERSNRSLSRNA